MTRAPRIAVLCATRRGHLFLERLSRLVPDGEFTVFSFREVASEPPFLEGIKNLSASRGWRFFETKHVERGDCANLWQHHQFELLFAVSWRYLVPASVFRTPRYGAFVFHDSLLPEYRGFSPTVWAIANGADHTGVTLFEMNDGVDTGPVVAQERVAIGESETIATVLERVTETYLKLLEANLPGLLAGTAQGTPQDETRATYCRRRTPDDNRIDWSRSAREVHNLIRAVTKPYPGAFTTLGGRRLTVWSASLAAHVPNQTAGNPGRVAAGLDRTGAVVATGNGAVVLNRVQLDGDEPTDAAVALKPGATMQ